MNWVDPWGLLGEELNPYTVPGQLPGKLIAEVGVVLIFAGIPIVTTTAGVVVISVGVGLALTGGYNGNL